MIIYIHLCILRILAFSSKSSPSYHSSNGSQVHLESPKPADRALPGLPVLRQVCTLHQMREVTFYYQKLRPLLTGAWMFIAFPGGSCCCVKKLSWVIPVLDKDQANMCKHGGMLRHIYSATLVPFIWLLCTAARYHQCGHSIDQSKGSRCRCWRGGRVGGPFVLRDGGCSTSMRKQYEHKLMSDIVNRKVVHLHLITRYPTFYILGLYTSQVLQDVFHQYQHLDLPFHHPIIILPSYHLLLCPLNYTFSRHTPTKKAWFLLVFAAEISCRIGTRHLIHLRAVVRWSCLVQRMKAATRVLPPTMSGSLSSRPCPSNDCWPNNSHSNWVKIRSETMTRECLAMHVHV